MERPPLADMLKQAYKLGVSDPQSIDKLSRPRLDNSKLFGAWDEFMADTLDFDDGSFNYGSVEDSLEPEIVGIHQLVVEAVGSLACDSVVWASAELGKPYSRYYPWGSEGTDWHNDVATGYDIVVLHTIYGRAEFGAIRKDGHQVNFDTYPGCVVAFDMTTSHRAGSPIAGDRTIEGIPIKFNHHDLPAD